MKPIAHFENRYKISPNGEVLNLANNTPLTPIQHDNGYFVVGLADGVGGHKIVSIHRLVALHYIPNPYEYPQVNHVDGDKANNHKDNLEWSTPLGNIQHALRTGLRKGYMSADDKEKLLQEVLSGAQVKDIAARESRRPETLHKMLRDTAKRLNLSEQWTTTMQENRRAAAIQNIQKHNATLSHSSKCESNN